MKKLLLCFIIIFTLIVCGFSKEDKNIDEHAKIAKSEDKIRETQQNEEYISPEKVIEIPDKKLEEIVRKIINKKTGALVYKDIESIEFIFAPNNDISSIEGLENFKNLITINISYNNIEDFSPLFKLKKLSYVNIEDNCKKEIDISAFTSQSELTLFCNKKVYNLPHKVLNNNNDIKNISLESYQENAKNIDYLILLDNISLLDSIKDFYDYKKVQGLNPWVELVQNIPKQNQNRTDDIRDYLFSLEEKHDLDYVLFIGEPYNANNACIDNSGGEIPMKYVYSRDDYSLTYFNGESIVYSKKLEYYTDVVNTPTDLFYVYDLNWYKDKDGYVGESNGIDFDYKTISLKEPLYLLGRIPFSENSIVTKILDNTIKLQKKYMNNHSTQRSALIASPFFGFVDSGIKDKINNINYLDISRVGEIIKYNLLESGLKVTTLYEKEGKKPSNFDCTLPLNKENFTYEFIKGNDIVITSGHGGTVRLTLDKDINKNGFFDPEDTINTDDFFVYNYNNVNVDNAQNAFVFLDACSTGITEGFPVKDDIIQVSSLMKISAAITGVGTTRATTTSPAYDYDSMSIFFMDDSIQGSYAKLFYNALGKRAEQIIYRESGNLSNIVNFNFFGDPSLNCFMLTPFIDVPAGYMHENSIKWAYENKIIEGYENKFNPDEKLTEAQFAVMLTRYGQIQIDKTKNSSHHSNNYYKELEVFNLPLDGYKDLGVKDAPINRGKVAKIIASIFGFDYDLNDAIMFMYKNNFSNGTSVKEKTYETYGKDLNFTRGEASAFLHRMSTITQVVDLEGNVITVAKRQIIGIKNTLLQN